MIVMVSRANIGMLSFSTVLLLLVVWSSHPSGSDAFSILAPPLSQHRPLTGMAAKTVSSRMARTTTSPVTRLRATNDQDDDGGAAAAEDEPSPSDEGVTEVTNSNSSNDGSSAANDILNSPDFLKRKLEVLQSDIAKAEQDLEEATKRLEEGKVEWGSQIDGLQKEYKNIQQRMNTQQGQSDEQATMQVARQMLGVLDDFDRAFGQVQPSNESEEAIAAEYQQAYDDILDIFEKLGVEEVPTVGIEFDYEIHQAVMQKPSDEYEEGVVMEELQKGFKIGDTLVRAAMVAVAA